MTQISDAGDTDGLQAVNPAVNPLLPLWQTLADLGQARVIPGRTVRIPGCLTHRFS